MLIYLAGIDAQDVKDTYELSNLTHFQMKLESECGIQFNWEYALDLLDQDPKRARKARKAFVGEDNWSDFKKKREKEERKEIYRTAYYSAL